MNNDVDDNKVITTSGFKLKRREHEDMLNNTPSTPSPQNAVVDVNEYNRAKFEVKKHLLLDRTDKKYDKAKEFIQVKEKTKQKLNEKNKLLNQVFSGLVNSLAIFDLEKILPNVEILQIKNSNIETILNKKIRYNGTSIRDIIKYSKEEIRRIYDKATLVGLENLGLYNDGNGWFINVENDIEIINQLGLDISLKQMDKRAEIENLTIQDLDLSVRSFNCLSRGQLYTVGDLIKCSKMDIWRLRNAGNKTVDEIVAKLEGLGYCYNEELEEFEPIDKTIQKDFIRVVKVEDYIEKTKKIGMSNAEIEDGEEDKEVLGIYGITKEDLKNSKKEDITIEELDLSIRSYNCLKRKMIKNVGDLIKLSDDDLIRIRNLGKRSKDEVVLKLEELGYYYDIEYECFKSKYGNIISTHEEELREEFEKRKKSQLPLFEDVKDILDLTYYTDENGIEFKYGDLTIRQIRETTSMFNEEFFDILEIIVNPYADFTKEETEKEAIQIDIQRVKAMQKAYLEDELLIKDSNVFTKLRDIALLNNEDIEKLIKLYNTIKGDETEKLIVPTDSKEMFKEIPSTQLEELRNRKINLEKRRDAVC